MDHTAEAFLSMINYTLHADGPKPMVYPDVVWMNLFHMAGKNALLPLLYDTLVEMKKEFDIPDEVMRFWKENSMNSSIREYHKYFSLRKVLNEADERNITLVLFKGCVLADLYPKYTLRCSCDTDIFVYDKDKDVAVQLLTDLGYEWNEEASKEAVLVYRLKTTDHVIELHTCLWEDYMGPRIEKLTQLNLDRPDSLVEVTACDITFTTLGFQQHLIYQLFHIIKHFSVQGISVRYLVDITLYVNRYFDEINQQEFWKQLDYLRFGRFAEIFFSICIRYFGMSENIMEARTITDELEFLSLIEDMIQVGVLYEERTAKWQVLGIMTPYLVGKETYTKSKSGRTLKVLFPSRTSLPEQYAYGKRHIVLLPIAWAHKMINYAIKRSKNRREWYDAKEKLNMAEYRISLMNELGLIEEK